MNRSPQPTSEPRIDETGVCATKTRFRTARGSRTFVRASSVTRVRTMLAVATLLVLVLVTIPTIVSAAPARPTTPCAQWHGAARAAGFSEAQWPRVARIMYRESRCRPGAHNRSGAHGLLQIMPAWRRRCGSVSSPAANLRCARLILRVQGWSAWS